MPSLLEELFVIRWLQQLVSNVAAPDCYVRGIDTRKLEVELKKEIIALNLQTSFKLWKTWLLMWKMLGRMLTFNFR